jgi:protein-S-isoprenylcysteine O-methyltransferase Ste14
VNLSRVRVRAGYTAGALALFFAEPTELSLVRGGALAILGELIRIWASGHIEKTHKLATGGPYAHTRNPLRGQRSDGLGLLVAVRIHRYRGRLRLSLCLLPFIIREAKFLRGKFPRGFSTTGRGTSPLLPRLTSVAWAASKYQLGRLANHEWRSVLGLALLAAFLIWRLP